MVSGIVRSERRCSPPWFSWRPGPSSARRLGVAPKGSGSSAWPSRSAAACTKSRVFGSYCFPLATGNTLASPFGGPRSLTGSGPGPSGCKAGGRGRKGGVEPSTKENPRAPRGDCTLQTKSKRGQSTASSSSGFPPALVARARLPVARLLRAQFFEMDKLYGKHAKTRVLSEFRPE